MNASLFEMIRDTYLVPRIAARRVLDSVRTPQQFALVCALTASIASIIRVLVIMVFDVEGDCSYVDYLGVILTELAFDTVSFVAMIVLTFGIGRLFGGKGTFFRVSIVMAWVSLATVVFYSPFFALTFMGSVSLLLSGLLIPVLLLDAWLFSGFVAEVHGFRSAWRVVGIYLGATVGMGAFLMFWM